MNHSLISCPWLFALGLWVPSPILQQPLCWSLEKERVRLFQPPRETYDLLLINRKIREEGKRLVEPMYEPQRDSLKIFFELPHLDSLGYFYFYFMRPVPIPRSVMEETIPAEYLTGVKEVNLDPKKNYRILRSRTIQPFNCRQLKLTISAPKNSVPRILVLQAKDSLDLFTLIDYKKDSEEFYIKTDPLD